LFVGDLRGVVAAEESQHHSNQCGLTHQCSSMHVPILAA
jgi:hypothetical protein